MNWAVRITRYAITVAIVFLLLQLGMALFDAILWAASFKILLTFIWELLFEQAQISP